jgi:hypothetical protein
MRSFLAFFVIAFLGSSAALATTPEQALARVTRAHAILGRFVGIAADRVARKVGINGNDEEYEKLNHEVKSIAQGVDDPNLLATIAIVSEKFEGDWDVEAKSVSEVFDTARRACTFRIAEVGGPEALRALDVIRRNISVDGGVGLDMHEAERQIRKRMKSK